MATKHPEPPVRGLTPSHIGSLRPDATRYDVSDSRAPGLRLRVNTDGSKVFRYTANVPGGGQKVITIGTWSADHRNGFVTLAQARDFLERLKVAHKGGRLDAEAARIRFEVDSGKAGGLGRTVSEVADAFYRRGSRASESAPRAQRASWTET